jgi:hypothetical protein
MGWQRSWSKQCLLQDALKALFGSLKSRIDHTQGN